MNINPMQIKEDIRSAEAELRATKKALRANPKPTGVQTRARRTLCAHATLLYAVVAHSRGHLHFTRCTRSHAHLGLPPLETLTLADQARFIGQRWLPWARSGEAA